MMVSSAFVGWQGDDGRKRRFVTNLQSKHWPKGNVKMGTLLAFALDLEKNDVLMSCDIKGGYHHCYLHPDMMRDYFLFRYDGQ